jgi:hypothetical protein
MTLKKHFLIWSLSAGPSKMRASGGVNDRSLTNLQRGLSFCCEAATTLNRFAWLLSESVEAYFRLDFFRTFLIKQESTNKNKLLFL